MEFTLALEFTFSSQRQWRYFTYIVDTAGLHQPPYIRGTHSTCYLLISGQRQYSTYIVDTAGFSSLRIFAIRTCVLLAHIRTFIKKKTRGSHECDHGFLFSSLSTITSCPFRRRLRLALLECPL